MDVIFGLWADGGAVPDHGGGPMGALGSPVVGPLGLIDLLETRLGLGGPATANVVRVAAFQAALERVDPPSFWRQSLAVDPWATAQTLLHWRDQLIALGWDPNGAWQTPRLADLARACRAANDMPPGMPDRVAALLERLSKPQSAPISRLRLIDPLAVLPSNLRRLIERVAELGTDVSAIDTAPSADPSSALGKLQRWMTGDQPLQGAPDGSVTVATCSSSALAAELMGQWFESCGDVVALIAQDGDADLLDHGLAATGQPRAGRSLASPLRGSLQLLLLAFKSCWKPFDAQALMEILIHTSSPVAPRAAWRLARALEKAPGLGGGEWAEAWEAVEQGERDRAGEDAAALAKVADRIAHWRDWAEPKLADPLAGMPIKQALEICDRTSAWAQRQFGATDDALYLATATLASDVRNALVALDRPHLPRILVERVIEQALDRGVANPHAIAEAAPWRSTTHAGAIWQAVPTVLWWNFKQTHEGSHRAPWSDDERQELAAAGCPPDDVAIEGRAASQAWERAILNAESRLLLITSGLESGEDDHAHPLAHRLAPGLQQLANHIPLEAALASASLPLAGEHLPRAAINRAPLPAVRASWPTPPAFASLRDQLTESATSLEALFSCQLMWALRFVARLRPGRARSIPNANQLFGNLAHAVAREVFPAGPPPTPDEARLRTQALLDQYIDELAAPLRHPELAEELTFARRRLPEAMAHLAQTLVDNRLTVEATETQVSGTFETILALRGAVDLVARDADGAPVIVDLKWTRSDKARVKELQYGGAVQLAAYGAMVARDAPYRAGYFLLNQRQFAVLEGSGLVGRQVAGSRTFPETWATAVETWKQWRRSADAGVLVASGVEGWEDFVNEEPPIEREVRCDWCDYATLCRRRGQA